MDIERARDNMLRQQLRAWHTLDDEVLSTVRQVPREFFVPGSYHRLAFADVSIPIGHGQVMMPPKEEGRMLTALDVKETDKVLEIGTGTGYMTALLATLAQHVHSVEYFEDLSQSAAKRLHTLGIENVSLSVGDGASGWSGEAPYDVIAITGALPKLPMQFLHDLQIGGRLFAILGTAPVMKACAVTRVDDKHHVEEVLYETALPYLLGVPEAQRFYF